MLNREIPSVNSPQAIIVIMLKHKNVDDVPQKMPIYFSVIRMIGKIVPLKNSFRVSVPFGTRCFPAVTRQHCMVYTYYYTCRRRCRHRRSVNECPPPPCVHVRSTSRFIIIFHQKSRVSFSRGRGRASLIIARRLLIGTCASAIHHAHARLSPAAVTRRRRGK